MARPRKNFNRDVKPSVSTSSDVRTTAPTDVVGNNGVEDTGVDGVNMENIVVEPEAIIPDSEVTPEMKHEEPINKPETAVPVVSTEVPKKSFKERMEECSIHFGQKYFDEMVKKGCDYKAFGDWQKGYCGLLDRVFGVRGKEVLDVGSAYGALGNGFKQLGAKKVTCVDISKQVIAAKQFDGLTYVLAPVQLMKAVETGSQDLIHASYLMNSVDAEDLDITFFEMKRVLAAKGKVFIIMNFGKDQKLSDFDTRHSKETIVKAATKAGFKEVTEIVNQLRSVDDGRYEFISNYNWGIVCFE
ncbi:MAG: hypothetical protein CVT92_02510 [Bacteroidetes bacterium HGW-Bacteroidetes-1]|jgi:ubiquinone/menaquinone biosynthesis C-methylase UbiE|nr:MAG: hypothetical protein CVT92_02510 [Bacteroidetes bacterium HGW-Bacteroidetes-1]